MVPEARRAAGRRVRPRCRLRPRPRSGVRAAVGQVIGAPGEGEGERGGETAAAPAGARGRAVPRVSARRGAVVAQRMEGALGRGRSSHRLARRGASGRGTFGRPRYCSPRTPPGTPSWRGPRGGNRGGGGASASRKPSCPAVRPSRRPPVPLRASSRAAACEGDRDAAGPRSPQPPRLSAASVGGAVGRRGVALSAAAAAVGGAFGPQRFVRGRRGAVGGHRHRRTPPAAAPSVPPRAPTLRPTAPPHSAAPQLIVTPSAPQRCPIALPII